MKRSIFLAGEALICLSLASCYSSPSITAGISNGTPAQTSGISSTQTDTISDSSAASQETTSSYTAPSGSSVAQFYPVDVEIRTDLDGDGSEEVILYNAADFIINGVSYREMMGETVFDNSPNTEHFIISDINTVDPSKEIGIQITGASDDHEVFFFRYSRDDLRQIGSTPVLMTDLSSAFDGKGYIYGDKRLQILQTWFAPARWKLEGSTILDSPYDLYYPTKYPYTEEILLNEDLPIYSKRGDSAPSNTMVPQQVEFMATDNSNWVMIKGTDGTSGWFKIDGWDHLIDLDKSAGEVFENLFMAD